MRRPGLVLLCAAVASATACGLGVAGQLEVGGDGGDGGDGGIGPPEAGPPKQDAASADASFFLDASSVVDASTDAPPVVQPLCLPGQLSCNGICSTTADCAGCTGAKLLCKSMRTCMTTCATCRDLVNVAQPIECFACDLGQANPIGTCEYDNPATYCRNGNYTTAYKGGPGTHCDCSNGDVDNCPGQEHVCKPAGSTDNCVTCGEEGLGTNGMDCKNGRSCDTTKSPPRCK